MSAGRRSLLPAAVLLAAGVAAGRRLQRGRRSHHHRPHHDPSRPRRPRRRAAWSWSPTARPSWLQGDTGSYVEALQFYLVCTGHGQLTADGPAITVDGQFGPMTADAVAWYQAELRRMPTGDPDEATFAQLARDCTEARLVSFPDREGTVRVAGNTAPGDEELIDLDGVQGRVLTIVVVEGDVQVGLERADGTRVEQITLGGGWQGKLPTDSEYRLRVTAAEAVSFALDLGVARPALHQHRLSATCAWPPTGSASSPSATTPSGSSAACRTSWESRRRTPAGRPATPASAPAPGATGTSPGSSSRPRPAPSIPAVLYVHFSDVDTGSQAFAEYAYVSLDPQAVDAGVMDLATAGGISIGHTVDDFAEVYGQPNFTDGTSGLALAGGMLFGFSTEGEEHLVWSIGAGEDGCDGYE